MWLGRVEEIRLIERDGIRNGFRTSKRESVGDELYSGALTMFFGVLAVMVSEMHRQQVVFAYFKTCCLLVIFFFPVTLF